MGDLVQCRFFARGLCRYGNSCRFYHGTQSERGSYYTPPNVQAYNYDSQQSVFNGSAAPAPSLFHQTGQNQLGNDSLQKIMHTTAAEMDEWEQCNIWPFSCYGPFGGRPCLPESEEFEVSDDELHLEYMINGKSIPAELQRQLNELLEQGARFRKNYKRVTSQNMLMIKSLWERPQPQDMPMIFSASTVNFLNQSEGSVTQSIFGTGPAMATQASTFGPNSIPFGNSQPAPAAAGSALSTFSFTSPTSSMTFNQGMDIIDNHPKEMPFSFTSFSSGNTASTQPQPSSALSSFSFVQPNISVQAQSAGGFGAGNINAHPQLPWLNSANNNQQHQSRLFSGLGMGGSTKGVQDNLTYSQEKNLTDEEMTAFKADEFMDFVPINPPPKSICTNFKN